MPSAVGVILALFYRNGAEVVDLMHMDDSYFVAVDNSVVALAVALLLCNFFFSHHRRSLTFALGWAANIF